MSTVFDEQHARAMILAELETTRSILAAAVEFDLEHDPECPAMRQRRCSCYLREIERETMNAQPYRARRPERAAKGGA